MLGSVEAVRNGLIKGWALEPGGHWPVQIEVRRAGQQVATGEARLLREDLRGLVLSGLEIGFEIDLGDTSLSSYLSDLEVFGNGRRLPFGRIDDAVFLAPRELRVTPTKFDSCLLIGSCLSENLVHNLKVIRPAAHIDHILFNNFGDLPAKPPRPLDTYDFQLVQLPLRSVLGDVIVDSSVLNDAEKLADIVAAAHDRLHIMLDTALQYRKRLPILTIVSNFIVPQGPAAPAMTLLGSSLDLAEVVRGLNRAIAAAIAGQEQVFLLDLEAIAASLGKNHFFDDTFYFSTHGGSIDQDWTDQERWPGWTHPEPGRIEDMASLREVLDTRVQSFYLAVYNAIDWIQRVAIQQDQVKLVIFDLDNTMWRGMAGDHYGRSDQAPPYNDGWPMGLWETVQQLRARGILVSLASKNTQEVVERLWPEIVQPPFIKFADFVEPRINWRPKAENIAEIMEAVSLTPKSVVFVDDNPVERASIQAAFPGIRVIGDHPYLTRRILMWSPETQVARLTNESRKRETMIRNQIERKTVAASLSKEDFLKTLQCTIELGAIHSSDDPSFARCFELLNKTNQFNTNGKRWTAAEIATFLESGGEIVHITVTDRFSSYGLVGVGLAIDDRIEQYVMSCRVLGLGVEAAAVGEIVRRLRRDGTKPIAGSIVETPTNMPCRSLYADCGFIEGEGGSYVLAAETSIAVPAHVTLKGTLIDDVAAPAVEEPPELGLATPDTPEQSVESPSLSTEKVPRKARSLLDLFRR